MSDFGSETSEAEIVEHQAHPVNASLLHEEGLAQVPEEFRTLTGSDGSRYEVFGAVKAEHLRRSSNEAATLFALKDEKDRVAIKIFLGWQTLFPEVKAAQFHDEVLKIPEEDREKRLIDNPENRAFWIERFAQHDFGEGYKADILTSESFVHLLAGPAVSIAAMRLSSDNQLELLGYGFVSNKGTVAVTTQGNVPEFMRYEDGHPALVTRYISGLLLLDDRVEQSPDLSVPPGMAPLDTFKQFKLKAEEARKKLYGAGFTDYDTEVYLDPNTGKIYLMDLGQIVPYTKESVTACITAIVQMYNLPEMFVKMLANKYWGELQERKVISPEA